MGGKASIIMVMGMGFLLGYFTLNLNRYATQAVGNMAAYNDVTASHNLAINGANVGLARFYQDTTWMGSITQDFNTSSLRGSFTARMVDLGGSRLVLRSISTYSSPSAGTLNDTVEVYFNRNRRNSFSMFAWMTNFEGNVFWITGDTVWGRVHSNGNLHMSGKPVFMEKLTTAKNMDPKAGSGTNKAIFKKGFETGIATIPLPSDISELVSAANSGGKKYTGNIWVSLAPGSAASGDGKAYIRATQYGTIIDSISLSDPGFNGVILGEGRVNVQGVLDGKLSIASLTDLYIQDNVTYEQNPMVGSSDDLLGLVADQNVVVANNTPNNTDCVIQASIFARQGSFTADDYDSRGVSGTLQIYGSIVQNTRGAVGQFSGSTLTSGFYKRYRFDTRLADPNVRPPSYPGFYVRTLAISDWWESYRITQLPQIAPGR